SYWNAASFNTPSSYLHFSTFQGETSADISFYFKTSAPYEAGDSMTSITRKSAGRDAYVGAPTVVSFSFDVGNGPVELNVHTPSPLNDDQWHRVSAERNTKEAILQLDQKFREVRAAPTQGHTRLELYSQLYVGAAGGQRGFLGCIRSLKMNGVTLDLEERAKVTPGVKPGCSGHCTSFAMYCRNGGKCVEKYNGYSCDCASTAYDGPFCSKDVGGYFEAGTLIKYNLIPEGIGASSSLDERNIIRNLPVESNLTREELTFSFSTSSSPSLLVYVSSKTQDYMAVVLHHNEPFAIDIDQRNLANGQPHTINISRVERDIQVQTRSEILQTRARRSDMK
ncbi:hypothetical protein DNTS_005879, partial [Danionella cerebrum]